MAMLFLLAGTYACKPVQSRNAADIREDDFLVQWLDTNVRPGHDFFRYATGNWLKNNPIPPSERRWGIANLVRDDNFEKLRGLCESAAADRNATQGSNAQKIGDFWATGMDSVTIDRLGLEPLRDELDRIERLKTREDLLQLVARHQQFAGSPMFSLVIYQDEMNSARYSLHLYQGGIGLPDRDYYFNTDARTKEIRNAYVDHFGKMFRLLGDEPGLADRHASTVMRLETDLARASRKLEDLRDPYANYHKMSIDEVNALTPGIDWQRMLNSLEIRSLDTVIVGQPEFFQALSRSLKSVPLEDWKTYLRWNLINAFAAELGGDFDKQNFAFYGTALTGVPQQRPRWKRILDQTENYLGDALGQLYVQQYVSPTMKKRYETLVGNMLEAYASRIRQLDWMSEPTRLKALEKLGRITSKVCYPDKWKDYGSMKISRDSYLGNVISARQWQYRYMVDKLYKPVDRNEWEMTPQTYNAYYNPSNNEIVLPAAQFLIPGLPDSLADDAIIYGYAAASTIGHELTHGFDDQGRQFDADGNLKNWWTDEDSARFTQRAQLIVDQFNGYTVLDSLHVNGKATLGENIADLGGVVIGLEAFKKTEQFKKGEQIDGLTPLQRYFLGYTLGWLGHSRDASLANQVMTDVHAPNFLRVNGPFSNVPEFYEAFGIKQGDPMWRPDSLRATIW
jgi:putative endopeptidase